MSCQQSNYTLPIGGPINPQDLSFELASTITVTFTPPTNARITGVNYSPNPPPTGYPAPTTGSSSITFSNPNGATTDFDVTITYVNLDRDAPDDSGNGVHPMFGPTTVVKFRPRSTCPTG
jgi:hypothetical protein